MSEERQYFSEQARERLELLGIAPGPKQPLDEKDAEIARLRSMLAYVARCLSVSDFCVDDRDYVASLATYINKRIPATELTDTYISEQTLQRLYGAGKEA